ncbi:hypothetical protein [Rhodococcus phage REQ1]|uniref:hypothetical protein n=1 Tax=Rhodococcus phage REQ1 TaxID=1109712 RepID=UPI00023EEBE7|nr:hypothetical protein RoPhREQ1_gp06 [Rhodococcus phage REQ1]AEV52002.1 hypothetical protein [Rhodococcus phage REQ1]
MTRLAVLLKTDGSTERIDLGGSDQAALRALYDAIGCSAVDAIKLAPNLTLWVDDEALLSQEFTVDDDGQVQVGERGANRYAGAIVHAVTQSVLGQELYGHVVFTAGADDEGVTRGLAPGFVDTLNGWVDKLRPLIEDEGGEEV